MAKKKKDEARVGIIGVGSHLPKKVLANEDLEKMVDTTDEWITTRTGIKERRIADEGTATSDMAKDACEEALKDANMKASDIDLIIVATITPDMPLPSTACILQSKLDAKNAVCFDISAACAGFIYGVSTAEAYIKSGLYKNALVVGSEKLSAFTDWKDRNTCVLFGDGAGAVVLAPVKRGGILSTYMGSDGTQADLLKVPAGGSKMPATKKTVEERLHYIKMSGSELFKHAVKIMADAGNKAASMLNYSCDDIDWVIPHQANIRILNAVANRMKLNSKKIYLNIRRYGNMSSASTAVALVDAVKEGRIKKGDIIVLDAFGAGLVWGAMVIEW
ncbi:MAG: ketoacyl-ACP synthase III [Candidatus Omnitrophica bacterium]|nr:ketoacyl-ACP synthase III [Candidatus Omnitrophota bacterium]